jgi:glyoxylase-like metal-dependent hydrolase (beta-lactamase superfamily II)
MTAKPKPSPSRAAAAQVLRLVVGPIETNCFLLWRPRPAQHGPSEALVFDPGGDAETILEALRKRRLEVAAILLTHAHFDHLGAVAEVKSAFPGASLCVHRAEAEWLKNPTRNLGFFFNLPATAPAPERLLDGGETPAFAGLELRTIHVPGHSPGGTAYYLEDPETPRLFSGDLLFQGGIGRTDFPGSAGEAALIAGIREKLFILPDNTVVHPGHGPETTIGEEKRGNPFCGF